MTNDPRTVPAALDRLAEIVATGPGSSPTSMSPSGHERRFRDVRDETGLPPNPEGLRQRREPALRARSRHAEG